MIIGLVLILLGAIAAGTWVMCAIASLGDERLEEMEREEWGRW